MYRGKQHRAQPFPATVGTEWSSVSMWNNPLHEVVKYTGKCKKTIRFLAWSVSWTFINFYRIPLPFVKKILVLSRRTSGEGGQWDIIQTEKSMTLAFAFAWHRQASQSHWFYSILGREAHFPYWLVQSEAIHLGSNMASSWSATTWTSFWNRDLLLMYVNSFGAPQ